MAPVPKNNNTIEHFAHPGHPLTPVLESNQDYSCDGCKTLGSGKKYRCCRGCDFDLHEYCATCPRSLTSSSMHPAHALALVMRRPQGARKLDRVCDVCRDPVEGLFYRCKECDFDVHPLCTQLPDRLQHALHKIHALDLQSPGKPGFCAVCRGSCEGWRYRCGACKFDIHLECVLEPVVPCPRPGPETCQRGIPPSQGPTYNGFPCYGPGMNFYGPAGSGNPYGPGNFYPNNMYNADQAYYNNMNPSPAGVYFMPPQNYYYYTMGTGVPANSGRKNKSSSMFSLVGQLGFGVLSNMIFGVDLSSIFG